MGVVVDASLGLMWVVPTGWSFGYSTLLEVVSGGVEVILLT